jgi:hypothetical protein
MRLSKENQTHGKTVRKGSSPSLHMQKKIELELSDYCKSEARGFSSWYELERSQTSDAGINHLKRRY